MESCICKVLAIIQMVALTRAANEQLAVLPRYPEDDTTRIAIRSFSSIKKVVDFNPSENLFQLL